MEKLKQVTCGLYCNFFSDVQHRQQHLSLPEMHNYSLSPVNLLATVLSRDCWSPRKTFLQSRKFSSQGRSIRCTREPSGEILRSPPTQTEIRRRVCTPISVIFGVSPRSARSGSVIWCRSYDHTGLDPHFMSSWILSLSVLCFTITFPFSPFPRFLN